MNIFHLDIYLELKYYPKREELLSQDNCWDILEILAYPRYHYVREIPTSLDKFLS